MNDNTIDPKFFCFVAQMSHILCGATLVLGTLVFFGNHPLRYILPAFTAITAVKEFWYDQHYENAATRGSNLLDFSMYQTGAYVAFGLFILKMHLIAH